MTYSIRPLNVFLMAGGLVFIAVPLLLSFFLQQPVFYVAIAMFAPCGAYIVAAALAEDKTWYWQHKDHLGDCLLIWTIVINVISYV